MHSALLYVANSSQLELARQYAHNFAFTLTHKLPVGQLDYYLYLNAAGLRLHNLRDNEQIRLDFLAGKQAHRFYFGGGQGQHLAKAIGLSSYKPSVLDLTAGFAQDAFVLAALGSQVSACEQNPVIAALVFDAYQRAVSSVENETAPIQAALKRLDYQFCSAQDYLANLTQSFDVIYLDPMFAAGSYSKVQVKKEAKALRLLAHSPCDASELLALALQYARCRVVVKRPKQGDVLAGRAPSYQLKGKAIRYDVYALKQVKPEDA